MAAVTEVTLADLANSAHAINDDGLPWDRKRVAIATDHVDNAGTPTKPEEKAVFRKEAHGHPWIKDNLLTKIVFRATGAAPHTVPTNATVVFPNHDYGKFQ